jgi:putative Mg2+ transporter-C (MgtC) family protein
MDDLYTMLISLGLGTLVGWEREVKNKPAGLRTHVLVCLGSTMFVRMAPYAVGAFRDATVDPTRVIHGVITGIGFLGAGAILRRDGGVHGLTTAASVWMVAAVGVASGLKAYGLAATGAVMALIVLRFGGWVEARMQRDANGGGAPKS